MKNATDLTPELKQHLLKTWAERSRLRVIELVDLGPVIVHAQAIGDDVFESLGTKIVVAKLMSYGSGGQKQVSEQLAGWKKRFATNSELI